MKVLALLFLVLASDRCLAAATQHAPNEQAMILVVEATRLWQANDIEGAQAKFLEAVEIDSLLTSAWLALSEINELRGAPIEALAFARKAIASNPDSPGPHLIAARVLASFGDVAQALGELAQARELQPSNLDSYLIAAILLRDANRAAEAIELLESGRDRGLNTPPLISQLGLLLLSQGNAERALQIAEGALRSNPGQAELSLVAGLALSKMPDRSEEAISKLRQSLEQGAPKPAQIHLELAEILSEAERYEEAITSLESAEMLLPDTPQIQYRLGLARRALGDFDGAQKALELFQKLKRRQDTADLEDKEVGTALNEAQIHAAGNRLAEASNSLKKLLEEHPDEPRALTLQGKVLFSMQRIDEALISISRARRLAPSQVENHFLEGLMLSSLGRLDEAQDAIERSLTLDPSLVQAHALRGEIAYRQGDFELSVTSYRAAMALGLENPTLRQHLADALQRIEQRDESRELMDF